MNPSPSPTPFLVELVGGGSNFWDSPFFLSLFTLLGVAVGATLTYVFGRNQDERKAKRELEERFLDRLLETASEIVREADTIGTLLWERVIHLSYDAHVRARASQQIQWEQNREQVDAAVDRLLDAEAALKLIAPATIRERAKELREGALAASLVDSQEKATEKAASRFNKLNQAFATAVRTHLGIEDPQREERPSRNALSAR